MTAQKLIRLGLRTAVLSALLGIAIYMVYYYLAIEAMVYLEYLFIFLAIILNVVIGLRIITHLSKHKRGRRGLIYTAAFMGLILLACLFGFKKIINLSDTLRIRFVNATGATLSDIKLSGCQRLHLNDLPPNETKTVWVRVLRDCTISITYKEGEKTVTKPVLGYITTAMGQEMTYTIQHTD